jgi:hypothetical protein
MLSAIPIIPLNFALAVRRTNWYPSPASKWAKMGNESSPIRGRYVAFLARLALVCAIATTFGCSSLQTNSDNVPRASSPPPPLPGKAGSQRVSQFVFHSDAPIRSDAPLLQELSYLRDAIYSDLKLPPSNSVVQVYIFDDRKTYVRFMAHRYPELPERRAFFIAQPRAVGGSDDLLVFTYWGDHIRQDLRHELTHAMLHSVLKDVPLWLDEGLAEFYELPPEKGGNNPQHLDAIRRSGAYPDLATLEKLEKVEQMGRPQYQESWAWVHWMLRGSPEARTILLGYLQELRSNRNPGYLMTRLKAVWPSPNDILAQHIARTDSAAATIRAVVDLRDKP